MRTAACALCAAVLPTVPSYVPRGDGMYQLRYVVDQDALREHLLTAHGPAPRPALRLTP